MGKRFTTRGIKCGQRYRLVFQFPIREHPTIYRWGQRYAPEIEKRLRWYWHNLSALCLWHMDETYVKADVCLTWAPIVKYWNNVIQEAMIKLWFSLYSS